MADNVTIDPGASPSAPIATDDVGGVHYQRVKLDVGADGASSPVVGTLPVSIGAGATRDVAAGAADVGVVMMAVRNDTVGSLVGASGDYTPLQTGPNGRLRVLPASEYKVVATGNLTAGGQTVAGTVDEYGTALLSVSGTYASAVLAFEGYDGANWAGIQTVRTDSTTVETGTAALTNTTRAWETSCHAFSQVRVRCVSITSGTVAVRITGSGTAIEPVPAAQVPAAIETTASLTALNQSATLALAGQAGAVVQITGTFAATAAFEVSADGGSNYVAVAGLAITAGTTPVSTTTGAGIYTIPVAGMTHVRVRCSAYTSGTIVATVRATLAPVAMHTIGGQIDRVIAGSSASSLGKAEDAAAASGDTGVFILGVRRDTVSAAPTSATGDYSEIAVNTSGFVGVAAIASGQSTGWTRTRLVCAATNNATNVKASAGNLLRVVILNTAAATRYVKFYDAATAPTVGTDTPVLTLKCAAGEQVEYTWDLVPWTFTTGIGFGIVTGAADTDNTAAAAGDVILNYVWI